MLFFDRAFSLSMVVVALIVGALGTPSTCLADRAIVRLRNGGIVTGAVEVYLPGERIVVRTDAGEVFTLTPPQVSEIHISAENVPPTATAPVPPATPIYAAPGAPHSYTEAPPALATAPHYQLRDDPFSVRMPSLFWPLFTFAGSMAGVISGGMLIANTYTFGGLVGGSVLVGLMAPLAIVASTVLVPRKIRVRRRLRQRRRQLAVGATPIAHLETRTVGASATLSF